MSAKTLMLRDLAMAAATHPRIEQAVTTAIRTVLPDVIEDILCSMYPGERVQLYAAKKPASMRRARDEAIRTEYNGRNAQALSVKYGISARMVFNIVRR